MGEDGDAFDGVLELRLSGGFAGKAPLEDAEDLLGVEWVPRHCEALVIVLCVVVVLCGLGSWKLW